MKSHKSFFTPIMHVWKIMGIVQQRIRSSRMITDTACASQTQQLRRWGLLRFGLLLVSLLAIHSLLNFPKDAFASDTHAAPLPQATPPALDSVTAITTGGYHTCALTSAGGVKCWGSNSFSQLGDDTTNGQEMPINVLTLSSGIITMSAGERHTCTITTNGGIKCWGRNNFGQLGDGTLTRRGIPVDVSSLTTGVSAIGAGGSHTCAVVNGGVQCWGDNSSGQLGNGSTTNSSTPVAVSGLTSGVIAIQAGEAHTCALTTTGAVQCWGENGSGRLGNGSATNSNIPVSVNGLTSGVLQLAVGNNHNCAVMSDGGVKCWGNNSFGQLGDGTKTNRSSPVDVNNLPTGVVAVAAGEGHVCAKMQSNDAYCWGRNDLGQLGNGTTSHSSTPVAVAALTGNVASLAGGLFYSCAALTDGGVKCWGTNNFGQLGNGNSNRSLTPVDVIDTTPTAVDDSETTEEESSITVAILSNDIAYADLDLQSLLVTEEPTHGTTSTNRTTGEITYTPNAGYAGDDSFRYQICNNHAATVCAVATVTITVIDPKAGAEETTNRIGKVLIYSNFNRDVTPPYATKGTYTLRFNFTNNSDTDLRNLFYQAADANNSFLLNADGGTPSGTGATITIPNSALPGNDGIYQKNEVLTGQEYRIGVTGAPWRMRMSIYAVPQTAAQAAGHEEASAHPGAAQIVGYILLDSAQFSSATEAIYLPVILR